MAAEAAAHGAASSITATSETAGKAMMMVAVVTMTTMEDDRNDDEKEDKSIQREAEEGERPQPAQRGVGDEGGFVGWSRSGSGFAHKSKNRLELDSGLI
jgi:hypothetical protein